MVALPQSQQPPKPVARQWPNPVAAKRFWAWFFEGAPEPPTNWQPNELDGFERGISDVDGKRR